MQPGNLRDTPITETLHVENVLSFCPTQRLASCPLQQAHPKPEFKKLNYEEATLQLPAAVGSAGIPYPTWPRHVGAVSPPRPDKTLHVAMHHSATQPHVSNPYECPAITGISNHDKLERLEPNSVRACSSAGPFPSRRSYICISACSDDCGTPSTAIVPWCNRQRTEANSDAMPSNQQ